MRANLKTCLILAGIFVFYLSALPSVRADDDSNMRGQTAGGLTGGANTPSAIAGILDKSPMSATIVVTGLGFRTEVETYTTQENNLIADIRMKWNSYDKKMLDVFIQKLPTSHVLRTDNAMLLQKIRPEGLLYLETQARIGGGKPFYVPGALISSGRLGLDVAAQSYIGEVGGYGVSIRKDLLAERQTYTDQAYAYNDYIYASRRLEQLLLELEEQLRQVKKPNPTLFDIAPVNSPKWQVINNELTNYSEKLKIAVRSVVGDTTEKYNLVQKFVSLSIKPQLAFIYNFRSFNHVGNIHFAGLSLSRLTPFRSQNEKGSGFTTLLNMGGVYFASDNSANFGPTRSAVRVGAALVWINHVPYNCEDKDGNQVIKGRWTWQAGVEYRLKNVVDGSDLFNVFVRRRNLSSGFETTVSVGKGSDNHPYVGLSFGRSVPLY